MSVYSDSVDKLNSALTKLPGIGPKSAERIIFYLLKADEAYSKELSSAIEEVKGKVNFCKRCYNLTEEEVCQVCSDPTRDQSLLCVVEEPKDIIAIEKAGGYRGLYHVLLGAISAIDGVGPSQLRIKELMGRIESELAEEVILATNPTAEGDATAIYLQKILNNENVKVSRISRGLPVGSHFDYVDQATIAHAIRDRVLIQNS